MKYRISLIFILVASMAFAAGAYAQAGLSSGAMARMAQYRKAMSMSDSRSEAAADTVLATFEFSSHKALDALVADGIDVVETFGDFAIVRLPLAGADRAAALPGVKAIDFGTVVHPMLDRARRAIKVDSVHNGIPGEISSFTGKDVVVGVFDGGFDLLSPAFLDTDGEPRVKYYGYVLENGEVKDYYTREELEAIGTDRRDQTHGTHVAALAAGSRISDALVPIYSKPDEDGRVSIDSIGHGPLPYYGIAPEADIMLVTSAGGYTSEAILLGIKAIIDNAKAAGKRAVINLSLGLNNGPHDGTSTFSRALAELGKEAVIVLSAGNEGSMKVSISHRCKDGALTLRTLLNLDDVNISNPLEHQVIEFRSDSKDYMSAKLVGVNKKTGYNTFSIPLTESKDESVDPNSFYPFDSKLMRNLERYFFCGTGGGIVRIAPDNGNCMAMFYLDQLYPLVSNKDIALGIEVTALSGVTITGFTGTDCEFVSGGVKNCVDGNADISISDMATGENVISVGSFNSRYSCPALDKHFWGYSEDRFPLYEPSYFTSYGLMPDGTTLPHVSAPGALVVAAVNRYSTAGDKEEKQSAKVLPDGPEGLPVYYDKMMGTSMASPVAAGTIALWLQADPGLTFDEIIDIINKTSIKDDIYNRGNNAAKMGAGRINALAGIKEVLARRYGAGIGSVSADRPDDVIFSVADGETSVFIAGAASVTVSAVTPSGIVAARVKADGQEALLSTAALAPGIYIINATDGRRSASRKISVR